LRKFIQYVTPKDRKEEAEKEEIKQVVWVHPQTLASMYDSFLDNSETRGKVRPQGLFGSVPLKTISDEDFEDLKAACGGAISKDDKIDSGILCWAKTWCEGKGLPFVQASGRFG